jgi:uncharacterized membrane protein YkvA (DUF1232 family)
MKGFLKAKADAVEAWVQRQPPKINVLCIAGAVVWLLSPLGLMMNVLIGPGQVGDVLVMWFIWRNVKALVRRDRVITVNSIAPEETNGS